MKMAKKLMCSYKLLLLFFIFCIKIKFNEGYQSKHHTTHDRFNYLRHYYHHGGRRTIDRYNSIDSSNVFIKKLDDRSNTSEHVSKPNRFASLDKLLNRLDEPKSVSTTQNPMDDILLRPTKYKFSDLVTYKPFVNDKVLSEIKEEAEDGDEEEEDGDGEDRLRGFTTKSSLDFVLNDNHKSGRVTIDLSSSVQHHKYPHSALEDRSRPYRIPNYHEQREQKVQADLLVATMFKEGRCKIPKPKIIHVKNEYPDPSKKYIPHCIILHQCGQDSGCCASETSVCSAKRTQHLEFYFHVTFLENGLKKNSVKKLDFYNHTECECINKLEEYMPRDETNELEYEGSQYGVKRSQCRCPREYAVRHLPDGACVCDCFDKQKDCLRLKRGKDYFNRQDQLCIQTGSCLSPSCEFGPYIRAKARCTKKYEKLNSWSRYSATNDNFT